MSKLLIH